MFTVSENNESLINWGIKDRGIKKKKLQSLEINIFIISILAF